MFVHMRSYSERLSDATCRPPPSEHVCDYKIKSRMMFDVRVSDSTDAISFENHACHICSHDLHQRHHRRREALPAPRHQGLDERKGTQTKVQKNIAFAVTPLVLTPFDPFRGTPPAPPPTPDACALARNSA